MAALILSPEAQDDLRSIGDWIAQDDPIRAESFVAELEAACADLLAFPRAYPAFPALGPDTHRRNHGRYAILYDVREEAVVILRVVHGQRDLDTLF